MRLTWAIVVGLAIGIGIAWWFSRDTTEQAARKRERAERAAAANAEDARPVLYRWIDANGVVQLTDRPPKGRNYKKIDRRPQPGMQVDGSRE
jgi:hypothetical protein